MRKQLLLSFENYAHFSGKINIFGQRLEGKKTVSALREGAGVHRSYTVMKKIILGNIFVLALAFVYWFLVDYIYAKNYELYHPVEWLMQLSFFVFCLISYDYTFKTASHLEKKGRVALALIVPALLTGIFLLLLYFFGLDLHILVGKTLFL